MTLVDYVETNGCTAACAMLGYPLGEMCAWLMAQSGATCKQVTTRMMGGENKTQICTHLGFCGTPCECGVCTKGSSKTKGHGRCLGLPYSCNVTSTPRHTALSSALSSVQHALQTKVDSKWCMAAQCDGTPENWGCCLTCF